MIPRRRKSLNKSVGVRLNRPSATRSFLMALFQAVIEVNKSVAQARVSRRSSSRVTTSTFMLQQKSE